MLPITGLDLLLDLHQVIAYHNKVTVDIDFKLGTLAERTSKQPDPPGTQQSRWIILPDRSFLAHREMITSTLREKII